MATITAETAAATVTEEEHAPELTGGWKIVARKELGDHLRSSRFVILLVLMALAGLAAVHSASGGIRDAAVGAADIPSVFLYIFILSPDRIPSFVELLGLIGPLLGIVFAFDAVNGERAQRTLPRLVSQPIHRDDDITGKFAAGIGAVSLVLVAVVAMVSGYGMVRLGITPGLSDLVRLVGFVVVAIAYISVWFGLAMLLSIVTRRAATAALAAVAVWLVFALFMGLIAGIVADAVRPVHDDTDISQVLANARLELNTRRLSPDELYQETTEALLDPLKQSTGILVQSPDDSAVPAPLGLRQSLDIAWWQLAAIAGIAVALFAASYALFLRQEIRA
ncbi:MAG TPA: ABC transporter permease [Acidimicrobiales bacterium]|nr:ABC transporter permease [Acidimicrobiales bacterium]